MTIDHLIVAQSIIHSVVNQALDDLGWEEFCPEIGECDWDIIEQIARQITPDPDNRTSVTRARSRLEEKCRQWVAEHPEVDA